MTKEREKEILGYIESAKEANAMDYGAYVCANDAAELLAEIDRLRSLQDGETDWYSIAVKAQEKLAVAVEALEEWGDSRTLRKIDGDE